MIHRSRCPGIDCSCADGRRPSAGHVRMYRDRDGAVRFVDAAYRQPHPGELATDVDGHRFRVGEP